MFVVHFPNRSLMLEKAQLPTDTVDDLSRIHQECEKITIANFLQAAIFDSDFTFQKQMKVCYMVRITHLISTEIKMYII